MVGDLMAILNSAMLARHKHQCSFLLICFLGPLSLISLGVEVIPSSFWITVLYTPAVLCVCLISSHFCHFVGYLGQGRAGLDPYVVPTSTSTPLLVSGPWGSARIAQIAAGFDYSMFVDVYGRVYASGNVATLGLDYDAGHTLGPMQISGLTNVVRVSAGYSHALFLTSSGAVYATGDNGPACLNATTGKTRSVRLVRTTGSVQNVLAGFMTSTILSGTTPTLPPSTPLPPSSPPVVVNNTDFNLVGCGISSRIGVAFVGSSLVPTQISNFLNGTVITKLNGPSPYSASSFVISSTGVYSFGMWLSVHLHFDFVLLGDAYNGQLARGTILNPGVAASSLYPGIVPHRGLNITQVVAHTGASFYLTSLGTVYVAGDSYYTGGLGTVYFPTAVSAFRNITKMAAGNTVVGFLSVPDQRFFCVGYASSCLFTIVTVLNL